MDLVLFSPSSKYLALIGERGISILEMPMRWGKFAEYDGGNSSVMCRYTKKVHLKMIKHEYCMWDLTYSHQTL